MAKLREFIFDNGKESKKVEAMSYKKAVKSYQASANLKEDGNLVDVEWISKKGILMGMKQILPLGRKKKLAR